MRGLYIHVPYCRRICPYCDFYRKRSGEVEERYVLALIREIGYEADGGVINSVFFGGGTPSLLSGEQILRIMRALHRAYRLVPLEITLEANPEDVVPENLKVWKGLGINRISIGVQTFSKGGLKTLGRWHTPEEGIRAVLNALSYGFITNADLIFAYPGQSLREFEDDLLTLVKLGVHHISAYALEFHEKTLFGYYLRKGKIKEREDLRDFYVLREELLTSFGYVRYELSNYAIPGYESIHNRIYWSRGWYKGFGPSASSFLKDKNLRYTNLPSLSRYLREFPPPREYDPITPSKEKLERLFLGLRTGSLSLSWYVQNFGREPLERVKEFLDIKGDSVGVKVEYLHVFDAIVRALALPDD